MDKCSCKGIRTCLLCENQGKRPWFYDKREKNVYQYCDICKKAWLNSQEHPDHDGEPVIFPGIEIIHNFVSEDEEREMTDKIYQTKFVDSQSGRRKQDYGPKVNFKKRKLNFNVFTGLPEFSQFLYMRMANIPFLKDFTPVEQCNLEYTPDRGSAIDPHFDDFWLWGERLVTLNLLSDTVLYFIKDDLPDVEIHVPMCKRSLLVVHGPARNEWKHGIHREDIKETRLAITYRELSQEFKSDGLQAEQGKQLIDIALNFKGHAVGSKVPES